MSILGSPYLVGAAAVIAFGGGWQVNEWRNDAKDKSAQEKLIEAHNEQVTDLEKQLDARGRENFELSIQLDVERQNVRTEFRTITQKVPEYVPQNTADCNCDLGRDFIILFNNAATRNKNGSTAGTFTPINLSDEMPRNSTDLAGG